SELQAARTKRDTLIRTIAALEASDLRRFDRAAVERKVREHVASWRSLLTTKHVQDGRQLLREVLTGPLRFTPEQRTYRFEGEAAFGKMLAGIAGFAPFVVAL